MQKVPWTIVLGDKEVAGGDYMVNIFGQEEGLTIPQSELASRVQSMLK
jgi:threonyl-tRNA synthetase